MKLTTKELIFILSRLQKIQDVAEEIIKKLDVIETKLENKKGGFMKIISFILAAIFFSACAQVVQVDDISMLGMTCSAREVRTSLLATVTAFGCVKPNGEFTNLVGGPGMPQAEVMIETVELGTTIGGAIAIGRALKGIKTGGTNITVTPP